MAYQKKSLQRYLEDLAAKKPAPGGGSAAALVSALGVSLLTMVANFTQGKERYRKFQGEIKKVLSRTEKLRRRLLNLVDEDVLAYQSGDIKQALRVPKEVFNLSFEAIKISPRLVKIGNRNLISDVSSAAIILEAGSSAAWENVLVNLKYLKKKRIRREIRGRFLPRMRRIAKIRREVEEEVGKFIGR